MTHIGYGDQPRSVAAKASEGLADGMGGNVRLMLRGSLGKHKDAAMAERSSRRRCSDFGALRVHHGRT